MPNARSTLRPQRREPGPWSKPSVMSTIRSPVELRDPSGVDGLFVRQDTARPDAR